MKRLFAKPVLPLSLPRPPPKDDISLNRRLKARSLLTELIQAYTNKSSPSSHDITSAVSSAHSLTKDELLCLHLCLDIPAPVQGDGGDERHRSYLATELTAYFEGLQGDDEGLMKWDVENMSAEELYCACIDRCIWPSDVSVLKLYLRNRSTIRLAEDYTYEELSKQLPALLFPQLFL